MRIQGGRAVYQHYRGTAPVQSICDARAIDIYRACRCHEFTFIYMMIIIHNLMRVMLGGKSRHREAQVVRYSGRLTPPATERIADKPNATLLTQPRHARGMTCDVKEIAS
jgi:hypothetical protein